MIFFENKRVCIIVRFGANFLRCVTSFGFGLRSRAEKIVHRFVAISDVPILELSVWKFQNFPLINQILRKITFGQSALSKIAILVLFRGSKF